MSKSGERVQSVKIVLVMLGITLWSLSILARLIELQVVHHEEYAKKAQQKQQNTQEVAAPRGIIYDSHMDELAYSITVPTVFAEPRHIEDKPEAAHKLAEILEIDPGKLLERMNNPARQKYLVIKRRIDPKAKDLIQALGIRGIGFFDQSKRVYPNRHLASHVLGFVNNNDNGSGGIEWQYDRELKGEDGLFSFDVDGNGNSFNITVEKPAVQGNSLVLSIDKTIQFTAERELEAAVVNSGAKSGIVIVMESDTGRILALANYPWFNSNTYNEVESHLWKNRAIEDIFEPGSTFKVVVAAAALDARLTQPDELIDCQNGSIAPGGRPVRDTHDHGLLTFTQVLEQSSNVGAVKLGLRLGQERLYDALRNFGFGSKTGIDLPGEIVGLVRDLDNWSGLSIRSISFGHEVGVTSIQILNAINAIANGGYRVRPTVVDRIIDENRNTIRKYQPERVQIISHRTAEAVTEAFEGVVLRGTGTRAALEGYRAAGKTGTAEKFINGAYSREKNISSFIGFAPLPHPKVTILVQLDEPVKGHYGGTVCAPYFKNIAQEVLVYLGVPPDSNLPLRRIDPTIAENETDEFMQDAFPVEPFEEAETKPLIEKQSDTITVKMETVIMPDFQGLSKKVVLNRCIDLGIHLKYKGSGVAAFQSPAPGTEIAVGDTCNVIFTKAGRQENIAGLTRISIPDRNSGSEKGTGTVPQSAARPVNLPLSSRVSP